MAVWEGDVLTAYAISAFVLLALRRLPSRAMVVLGFLFFVLAVWALQLWWSPVWLNRFRFGPMEWAWRTGTYRRLQPLRR